MDNVKNRILLYILINNVPTFKQTLLKEFREELSSKGIDIENVCSNKKVKQEVEQTYRNINSDTMITLPNGKTMTKKEYLEINGVLRLIPDTSIVILKNGMKMTGKEFIKDILDRASQFNTFQELFNYYVEEVDNQNDDCLVF